MCTFIENYLHFIKNCIRPPYKKLKSLKSGFIENSNFENNRDPWGVNPANLSNHWNSDPLQNLQQSRIGFEWSFPRQFGIFLSESGTLCFCFNHCFVCQVARRVVKRGCPDITIRWTEYIFVCLSLRLSNRYHHQVSKAQKWINTNKHFY